MSVYHRLDQRAHEIIERRRGVLDERGFD